MTTEHLQLGNRAEELAAAHLRRVGYKIIEQNYRTAIGEIDIIARHKGTIVFAEVKARSSAAFGSPKHAVTQTKQRKISMVALSYLKATRQMNTKARFDVVSVNIARHPPEIQVITNAFELAYT